MTKKKAYYLVVVRDPHDDDEYSLFRMRVNAVIFAEGCKTGLTREYPSRFTQGWEEETDSFGHLHGDLVLRFSPVGNDDGFMVAVFLLPPGD